MIAPTMLQKYYRAGIRSRIPKHDQAECYSSVKIALPAHDRVESPKVTYIIPSASWKTLPQFTSCPAQPEEADECLLTDHRRP